MDHTCWKGKTAVTLGSREEESWPIWRVTRTIFRWWARRPHRPGRHFFHYGTAPSYPSAAGAPRESENLACGCVESESGLWVREVGGGGGLIDRVKVFFSFRTFSRHIIIVRPARQPIFFSPSLDLARSRRLRNFTFDRENRGDGMANFSIFKISILFIEIFNARCKILLFEKKNNWL